MKNSNIKNLKPSSKEPYVQGYYKIINPGKYIGDVTKIIYRSSYERKFCVFCDNSEKVLKWASEPFPIKYYNPVDKQTHEYNIDFYMKFIQDSGIIGDFIIEVKPKSKLMKPEAPSKQTLKKLTKYNDSIKEYITLNAKFAAARAYARKIGYKFIIVTEDFLYRQHGKS